MTTLANAKIMTFVAARDAARAKAFYGDSLGLRFVSEDQYAVVFDLNGTMLRVQIAPDMKPAKYTVLGWQVPDIAAAVESLGSAGVEMQRYPWLDQKSGIWNSPSGAKVAWFQDPDGNILSLTEF